MKKFTNKTTSKETNKKNVRFKLAPKDSSIMNIKWNSPNDNKGNTLDINVNPKKFSTIKIEDNH